MCRETQKNSYLKPGRLADVLGLIQALGFDSLVYRSERGEDGEKGGGGLVHELKATPASAKSWLEVAKGHPEFFRVAEDKKYPVSLICRHTHYTSPELREHPFDTSIVHGLMQLAIELHDREVKRAQGWALYIPIWVAAISAGALLVTAIIEAISVVSPL